LAAQIWQEIARHHLRDMPAYATFLFGQTTPVDHTATHCFGSCDMTNLHVAKKPPNLPSLNVQVKPRFCQSVGRALFCTPNRSDSLGANALQT
jgi:hypothetical protein